jgi:hypothetical protein
VPLGAPTTAVAAKEPAAPTRWANGGVRAGCDEGRAVRRVGVRDDSGTRDGAYRGASDCNDTHGALTGGGGGNLKGGDGRSQGGRSDVGGG